MACLDAIAKQSVMPDEVIVVDNNSTDRTVEIAKLFKFVKVVTEKRQGVVWARNKGFDAASSDILGRIDADTVIPAKWVAYVKRYYGKKSNFDHALTGGAYFYNIRMPRISSWGLGQIAFRMNRVLLGHYITYGSNMAFPASMWGKIRSEVCDDNEIHEDLDLAIHLHRSGFKITYKEKFKVGVKMRRVRTGRSELWENMMWWPRTLRRHGKKTWVLGWVGAAMLYTLSPLLIIQEKIARLFTRKKLEG